MYHIKEARGVLFAFKHAMIQEAAYSSLLKEERRELHARAASWLAQEAPIGESSHPAVLGYHYARAGYISEAVEAWLQAAFVGHGEARRVAARLQPQEPPVVTFR